MDCIWSLLTATDGYHAWVWDIDQQKTINLQDRVPLTNLISSRFHVMDFSYDGSLLASCTNSKASFFLSKIGRDNINTVENSTKHYNTAVKFLRKSSRFLALGSSNSQVYLYDLKSRTSKFNFTGSGCGNGSEITALQSDFNDHHIVSGNSNGNISFHSCTNGTSSSVFSYPDDMAIAKIIFNSKKRHLLVSGHESGAIKISDVIAKKTVRSFNDAHFSPVVSLFSPSLLPSSLVISIGLDKKMVFYDVDTSKITQSHQLTHHAVSCDLNLCERILAIGSNDGIIRFYDLRNFSKCFKEIATFINTPILNLNFLKLEQDSQQAVNKRQMAPTLEPQYIPQASEEKAMNGKCGNNIKRGYFNMSSDSDGLYSPIRMDSSQNRSISRSKSADDLSDSSFNKYSSPKLSLMRCSFANSPSIPTSSPKVAAPKLSLRSPLANSLIIPTSPKVVIPKQIVDNANSRVQIMDDMNSNVQIMDNADSKKLNLPNPNFPICINMDEQTFWSKMKGLISEVLKESHETGSVCAKDTCANALECDKKPGDSAFPETIASRGDSASTPIILEQTQVAAISQAIENVSTSVASLRHLIWNLHTGLIKCMNQNQSEFIEHLNDLYSENERRTRVGSRKCKYCDTPGI